MMDIEGRRGGATEPLLQPMGLVKMRLVGHWVGFVSCGVVCLDMDALGVSCMNKRWVQRKWFRKESSS